MTNDNIVSPYTYKSELLEEQLKDKILHSIVQMCMMYNESLQEFKKHYTSTHILSAWKFITQQEQEVKKQKKMFKDVHNLSIYTNIGHYMDILTLQEEVLGFDSRSNTSALLNTLLTLEVILDMCKSTLYKIIYTKKERDDN